MKRPKKNGERKKSGGMFFKMEDPEKPQVLLFVEPII